MVATAHSDQYAIFLRKIGYSVGLEYTAERVNMLAKRYLNDNDLTIASWHELTTGKKEEGYWGRDKSAEKHIADFFNSLRLIQRTSGDLLVLENLDSIAISAKLTSNAEEQRISFDFLLLWAILVNDGEIFINLLLSNYEEQKIKDTLAAVICKKRTELAIHLSGKAAISRINRAITIERQEKNKGSAGGGLSVSSIKRTEPLQPERTSSKTSCEDVIIELSNDYLRKVPPRRRDWAISLGLWDDAKGITKRGHAFLESLRHAGYIDNDNCFIFWPMDYELVRSGFRPDLFGDHTKTLWACLRDFSSAYTGLYAKQYAEEDTDFVVTQIRDMMEAFRSLHIRKSILRRELPLTVAYPTAIALACAKNEPVRDFPSAISAEQKGEHRRVALRQSRNTGGALSTKR